MEELPYTDRSRPAALGATRALRNGCPRDTTRSAGVCRVRLSAQHGLFRRTPLRRGQTIDSNNSTLNKRGVCCRLLIQPKSTPRDELARGLAILELPAGAIVATQQGVGVSVVGDLQRYGVVVEWAFDLGGDVAEHEEFVQGRSVVEVSPGALCRHGRRRTSPAPDRERLPASRVDCTVFPRSGRPGSKWNHMLWPVV